MRCRWDDLTRHSDRAKTYQAAISQALFPLLFCHLRPTSQPGATLVVIWVIVLVLAVLSETFAAGRSGRLWDCNGKPNGIGG
jgi:hypothetical protein